MKEIQLTQGKFALVDDADFEKVNQYNWCAGKQGRGFYAMRNIRKPDGKRMTFLLHRFLMPGVAEIDHIDGDGLNNQRANLRPASHRQNMQASQRKREGTSSSFRGVYWHKDSQKWLAQIKSGGKKLHLGYFSSEQEAALAYDVAAKQYFGEFAQSNICEK